MFTVLGHWTNICEFIFEFIGQKYPILCKMPLKRSMAIIFRE